MRGSIVVVFLVLFNAYFSQTFRDEIKAHIEGKEDKLTVLLNELNQYSDPYERAVISNLIGLQYQYSSQLDSAMFYHRQALSLSQQADSPEEQGISLNKVGIVHYYTGNIDSSVYYFQLALTKLETKEQLANCQNNLGLMLKLQGKLDESIEKYLLALNTYKDLENVSKQVSILSNIGSLHTMMGEYDESISYHEKAEAMALSIGDDEGVHQCKANIASTYIALDKYSEALELLKQTHSYFAESKEYLELAIAKNNMANCLYETNKVDSAKLLYIETYDLLKELGVVKNQYPVLANLAGIYQEEGNTSKALTLYKKALKISNEGNFIEHKATIYNGLASLYTDLNMADSAVYFKDRLIALKDSLDQVEKEKKALELNEKYKNDELSEDLDSKQSEINEVNQKVTSVSTILWWSILGLFVLIGVSIWLYWSYKKKKNEVAEENKKVVNLTSSLSKKESELEEMAVQKGIQLKPFPEHLTPLTEREKEVLLCAKDGLKDKEISERLFISVTTVRTHMRKAYVKIDARNRAEAIKFINEYEL